MALLSIAEAAIQIGYSIELLVYLTKNCPKHGEDLKLKHKLVDGDIYIDKSDLFDYQRYLNEKWPIPKDKKRPPMRDAIANDVKSESNYGCAICGSNNNGELAHINPVSDGASNSPDNLIFLCPNHHTAYDYGHKVDSTIRKDVIDAAKLMKRDSRRRMLRHEANATKAMLGLIQQIKKINTDLASCSDVDMRQITETEVKSLMSQVAVASSSATKNTKADLDYSVVEIGMAKIAPTLESLSRKGVESKTGKALNDATKKIIAASDEVFIDLGEEDCPHCTGSGLRGISGSLCSYCKGSCYVSTEMADSYSDEKIDEVPCPRCHGHCQTGWTGDLCSYCEGDGVVTSEMEENYTPDKLDEVDCPHCNAAGTIGLSGTFCSYCHGSCFVTRAFAEKYDRSAIDEVDCPRCAGRGLTGLTGCICIYCGGDGQVSEEKFDAYDPNALKEVDCPHCNGSGQTGRSGEFCSYCGGDCHVSRHKHDTYNASDMDEETCPRCGGSGETGRVGDRCKLCHGNCVVSHAKAEAYRERFGE